MDPGTGPGASGGGSKGLVLVVEDERSIADLLRMYLTREGFGVHVEHDGAAGLAAARSLHPVAVVLDVGLPGGSGMDGTEVCRRLRRTPRPMRLPQGSHSSRQQRSPRHWRWPR